MPPFVQSVTLGFRRLVNSPRGELNRWQRAVRFAIDLSWHCAKALNHDKAEQMAAALTYRTIFSLIPVVVLSLLVFKAFGGFSGVGNDLQTQVMDFAGIGTIGYQETSAAEGQEANRVFVVEKINEAIAKVETLDEKSLGVVGFILLVWTALGLVISLEHSFNQVFGAAEGRSLGKRVVLYWTSLTLGPVLIFASLWMKNKVVGSTEGIDLIGPALASLSRFTALGATWLLLLFLYMKMPNTVVRLKPAVIGAFVAAVLWEFAKFGFALYVRKAVPYTPLYGTMGLIPLFLFWVYLTWIIILFGLELTYTLQAMRGGRFKYEVAKQHDDQLIDTAWLVPLAARIAEAFHRGRPAGLDELSLAMNLPPRAVNKMLVALEQHRVVHRVSQDGEGPEAISLSRPADRILVADVLEAGQALLPTRDAASNQEPAWKFLTQLQSQGRDLLQGTTLADLTRPVVPPKA